VIVATSPQAFSPLITGFDGLTAKQSAKAFWLLLDDVFVLVVISPFDVLQSAVNTLSAC
jgi:hypothetical protein